MTAGWLVLLWGACCCCNVSFIQEKLWLSVMVNCNLCLYWHFSPVLSWVDEYNVSLCSCKSRCAGEKVSPCQNNPLAKTGVPDVSAVMIHAERGEVGRSSVLWVTKHGHFPFTFSYLLLFFFMCILSDTVMQLCKLYLSSLCGWAAKLLCCLFRCARKPVWHYHIHLCVNEITHRRVQFTKSPLKMCYGH